MDEASSLQVKDSLDISDPLYIFHHLATQSIFEYSKVLTSHHRHLGIYAIDQEVTSFVAHHFNAHFYNNINPETIRWAIAKYICRDLESCQHFISTCTAAIGDIERNHRPVGTFNEKEKELLNIIVSLESSVRVTELCDCLKAILGLPGWVVGSLNSFTPDDSMADALQLITGIQHLVIVSGYEVDEIGGYLYQTYSYKKSEYCGMNLFLPLGILICERNKETSHLDIYQKLVNQVEYGDDEGINLCGFNVSLAYLEESSLLKALYPELNDDLFYFRVIVSNYRTKRRQTKVSACTDTKYWDFGHNVLLA
jgi:hypothetical protein